MDWEKAEEYLKEIWERYESIGSAGIPALKIVIMPMVERFSSGERTKELYEGIMALE